jgi:CheY-like chemotaxis protein
VRIAARPTAAVIDMSAGFRESPDDLPDRAGFSVHFLHPQGELLRSSALSEVDCVTSDVVMPRVDGFALRRLVRTAQPTFAVILVTGRRELAVLDRGSRPRHRQHLRPRRPPSQRRACSPRTLFSRCRGDRSYLIRARGVVQTSPSLWLYRTYMPSRAAVQMPSFHNWVRCLPNSIYSWSLTAALAARNSAQQALSALE